MMQITSAEFVTSSVSIDKCPPQKYPEVAFIGRSNVGKSSLINRLTNKKGLAKTSGKPGKTQTINHFVINENFKSPWYLVDLPGYGYAKVAKTARKAWSLFIEEYLTKRENLCCVFVLIDARLEPQKLDLEFITQLGEWGLPFAVIFTKADKMKPGGLQTNVQLFEKALLEIFHELPNILITSADNGLGKDELTRFIFEEAITPDT